ncbi:MAG: sodium:glutamate symporter [Planctomycetota bacterium]|nr:sodium:glutamate symporter [Planctomycetota bacterium]
MEAAALAACGLLLFGALLRARLGWLQRALIPASVAGGLVGLVLVQLARRLDVPTAVEETSSGWSTVVNWVAVACPSELSGWPGWLIAVVFAGLLLDRPARMDRGGWRRVMAAGVMVWVIILGQVALGLLATWLIIQPLYPEIPAGFGLLIETGWAGGHGTAAAMGGVFRDTVGWEQGADLGVFMATVGLGWSVVSGIAWTNLAVRRGWTRVSIDKLNTTGRGALEPVDQRPVIGRGVIRSDVLDPLVFQVLILAMAFLVGMGASWAVKAVGLELVSGLQGQVADETIAKLQRSVGNLPLFLFTLLGGLAIRRGLDLSGWGHLVDGDSIRRLTSVAMEFLVVAAIASLKLDAVLELAGPLTVLIVLAVTWTAICLLWIGRRVLPADRWMELGLINYGMSTGTTATGLLLLRMVDKDLESGAAEDYALAAPLSAPFIGGGLLTLMMPLLLEFVSLGAVAAVSAASVVGLVLLGRRI